METLPLPCLALQQRPATQKPTFFSIFGEEEIDCDIDGLTNNKFWVTPEGWILVRDAASLITFLMNPLDYDNKIQLPHLPEDLPRESTCLLSGKPADPAGGCVVLLVESVATVIWYCRIGDGDGEEWTRHEYDIGTHHEKVPICSIAGCRRKFYFNNTLSGIGVLEFSPSPTFTTVKLAGEFDVVHSAKVFLVESGEELYMVSLVYGIGCDMTDGETRVYRMDFSEQPPRWRRADDLGGGGRAFVLAPWYFGASCSAEKCGLEEDCVVVFFPGDDDDACVKISSVRDEEVEFMQVPAAHRALWILPTGT
ncbi:hypothetical protein E2562_033067 [Oryza meyeriana var. granulata]|uniref:KIB1-4 beta-propeller domain-containing protein n=1 Tax=Oryza meyeriana var. granulata TaxID=110450 RepID=A0A6G1DR54_9ORYZ|nr:hypothetical protein E2562_033067 [Oryza meyeriana var. granulata]